MSTLGGLGCLALSVFMGVAMVCFSGSSGSVGNGVRPSIISGSDVEFWIEIQ